eukprot:CAMPEP_0177794646 /NCGR_PEP_ID=MMETSP0491_2-20121128/25764_1 /TAXON_ID=63592 /ORGANISM="Tetraselmis chuii, Strain PLY429" /LENGTH=191 /DNA_ID=CAMNT_0019317331 /DNA_START=217 /DNA_END=788 /DNA_ORIENTATION=+
MTEYKDPSSLTGLFWFSTATAFLLAFTIGANDVANNFGTSVGSGAVTMRTAIIVAGIAEILGAVTLGSGVSDTIVRGISDLDSGECWDCGGPTARITLFMLGMACALTAGGIFLFCATWAGMPVSTNHERRNAVVCARALAECAQPSRGHSARHPLPHRRHHRVNGRTSAAQVLRDQGVAVLAGVPSHRGG